MVQSLTGKQHNYFGSNRTFYSGTPLGSTAAWTFVNFSGTNTKFGAHSNEEANRFAVVSSGTSVAQWSWNSGLTIAGEIYGGNSFTIDGVFSSGVWLRSDAASQKIQIWAW